MIETLNIDNEMLFISDTARFKQILLNILANAVKFTYEGGIRIVLEISNGVKVTDTPTRYGLSSCKNCG